METDHEKRIKELEIKFTDLETAFWRKLGPGSNSVSTNVGDFAEIHIKGVMRSVKAGDSIQAAIDYINDRGGGEVRLAAGTYTLTDDITMYSGIVLVGAGLDSTILEFSGAANGVLVIGTGAAIKTNFEIRDLTIQNSNNTAGLDIQFADFWIIDNVKISSCDQAGLRVQDAANFTIADCSFDSNTGNGASFIGTNSRNTRDFTISNSSSTSNGGIGFSFNANSADLKYGALIACRSTSNTGDGFDFAASSASGMDISVLGCSAATNSGIGFDMDSNSQRVYFVNCFAESNTGDGFEVSGTGFLISGCFTNDKFDLQAAGTFVGNHIFTNATTDPKNLLTFTSAADTQASVMRGGNTRTNRKSYIMKNTSGGALAAGDVVILKSVATGDEVTTTTTAGDDKVFGMADATIADGEWGDILIEGYTTQLKVDGTTDIAIGDFLGTFTTAKIAQKAAAGDMCFAIALEAYTANDSSGVIDALIFSPRLI